MKRKKSLSSTCTYFTILCITFFLMQSVQAGWEELLINGGFENGSTGWTMKNLVLQTDNVYEGSQAAKMTPGTWYYQGYQYMDVNGGDELVATGYLATDSIVGSVGVSLRFYDASNNMVYSVSLGGADGTTDYTEITTGGIFAPDNAVKVMLRVGALGVPGGTAYVDGFSVMRRTPDEGTEILVNGDFEDGFTGWTKQHAALETTEVFAGVNSSCITAGTFYKFMYQYIDVTPGTVIQGRAYIKAIDTIGSGGITIRFHESDGTQIGGDNSIGWLSGTTKWTYKESAELTVPDNTSYMQVRCAIGKNAGGAIYYDNISIRDITPDNGPDITFADLQYTEQMTNGGFENDFATWDKMHAQTETTYVYEGSKAARLPGASYFKQFWYQQAAAEGDVYCVSLMAACSDLPLSSGMSIRFLDASETVIESYGIGSLTGTRIYREYKSKNVKAPVGTAYVRLWFNSGSGNSGGYSYYDNVSLKKITSLPIEVTTTFESAGYTILSNDSLTTEAEIYYRKSGETEWQEVYEPFFDPDRYEFRGSIVNLDPDSEYELYAILTDDGVVVDEGGVTFSTWESSPTIGTTYTVSQLCSGGQMIVADLQGTPDSWIKITGTGSADVDGAYLDDEAVLFDNCAYIILDTAEIIGGRRYGIQVKGSKEIRIMNCDISGYAREPNYVVSGKSYETQADVTADKPINMDGGIYINKSEQVLVERCYIHDPRLSANSWTYGHPCGPEGIVVANGGLTGNHVVRYNDIIGSDTIRWNDGIEGYDNNSIDGSFARDSDIYGNMICFGQDDVIELDGGQENVRFFGNKGQGFLCGVSTAPNRKGPCYIFGNLISNLKAGNGNSGAMVKQGGGDTYTRGFTYFFNNTFYSRGYGGICGVGFGDDANRGLYFGVSRNNVIYALSSTCETIEDEDYVNYPFNSFDYDNLWNVGRTSALVDYASGQEPNGILDDEPQFSDADGDDFSPLATSSAIDSGTVITNFTKSYEGSAPEQGAIEYGTSSLLPVRPIDITADTYRIVVAATAGGSSDTESVTLDIGDLDNGSATYKVLKNATADWLLVTNSTGTAYSDSTLTLSVSVDTAEVTSGNDREAVILIRFENGMSVPVTVKADVQ